MIQSNPSGKFLPEWFDCGFYCLLLTAFLHTNFESRCAKRHRTNLKDFKIANNLLWAVIARIAISCACVLTFWLRRTAFRTLRSLVSINRNFNVNEETAALQRQDRLEVVQLTSQFILFVKPQSYSLESNFLWFHSQIYAFNRYHARSRVLYVHGRASMISERGCYQLCFVVTQSLFIFPLNTS